MKFSTILALALASYTTLATAQQNGDFRSKNADDAEKLTNDFKKLTKDSPCQSGQDACVGDQFAQCVNGKFALTSCASGTKCVVLPLVNKPGTSITCDTEADRKARLAEARGQQPNSPPQGKNATTPDGKSKDKPADPNNLDNPQAPPQGKKSPDNGKEKKNHGKAKGKGKNHGKAKNAKGKDNGTPQQPNAPPQGKNATTPDGKSKDNPAGSNNLDNPQSPPQGKNATSQNPKDFRAKNADDAEKLTNDFKKLTKDSPCQSGQNACVGDQFAQCVNGKFALTSCASGTKCVVLPLVNKPGTSITCDTEADRKARLAEARGQQPKRRSAEKRRFIKRYQKQ